MMMINDEKPIFFRGFFQGVRGSNSKKGDIFSLFLGGDDLQRMTFKGNLVEIHVNLRHRQLKINTNPNKHSRLSIVF